MKKLFLILAISFFSMQFSNAALGVAPSLDKENVEMSDSRVKRDKRLRDKNVRPMARADFKEFCGYLKEESFDDRRMKLLRVASMGSYFTAGQVAYLLDCFSFEDKKVEALQVVLERIVDRRGMDEILERFKFPSSKEKALDILFGR